MKQSLFFSLLLITLFSCKKETPVPEENKQLANQFENFLENNHFRLMAYYSEQPFDYDPADTVPAKTNHWQYVSYHLKDDIVQFAAGGTISIDQNINWMPGTTEQVLTRNFKVAPDQQGVAFQFLNFTYDPLTYRLEQITDSAFIVRAQYNGSDVISQFKVLE